MQQQYQNILQGFSGIIKNLGFYPPEHASVKKQIASVADQINKLLATKKHIELGLAEDIIYFEDVQFYEMPPALEELRKRLEDREITGLIFQRGVIEAEISTLLQILAKTDSTGNAAIAKALQDNNVKNITLEDVETDLDERAKKVYSEAKETVVGIMQEARLGHVPKAERALSVVRGMQEIIQSDSNAIMGLTMLSDYDNYTFNHSVNVGVLASTLGDALNLDKKLLADTGLAGLLHDVGKTNTPIEIINKPGKLTSSEWNAIKQHPVDGAKIIEKMKGVGSNTSSIVLEHHAKYDLTGYPSFEDGHKLNIGSMVVAIADTYDSMTTLRPYQKRFDPKEAIGIMLKMRGTAFEPEFLDKFIYILGIYPVGTLVRLDTGEIGLVSGVNPEISEKPKIKVIYNDAGKNLGKDYLEIDLADQPDDQPQRNIVSTLDPMSKNIDLSMYN